MADIKSILGKIGLVGATVGAGALNTASGGALTPLTNQLLSTLGKALDPTAKTQLDLAVAAQQAELQKLEYDHAEKIATLMEQDTESARARQAAVKDRTPTLLAIGVTLGFFGLLALQIFKAAPEASHDVVYLMIGSLGTAWVSVVGYYFGSSAGSDRKTEILAAGKK